MKIKLVLLDIDGCLYHKYSSIQYQNEPHETWILESNETLLEHIIKELKTVNYQRLVLAYGTNRQDKFTDNVNSFRGGSMALALPILQAYLSQALKMEVCIEPFLMSDIYGKAQKDPHSSLNLIRSMEQRHLAAGESYKHLLRSLNQNTTEEHAQWIFDHSKVSLIYAHAHRVAHLHPTAKISINFFDDSEKILLHLEYFFSACTDLLPMNVNMNTYLYSKGNMPIKRETIQGNGIIDEHYDWSVRFLSSQTSYFAKPVPEDKLIHTATQLKAYHDEDHYRSPYHLLEMDTYHYTEKQYIRFKAMRLEQIPRLDSNPKLMASAYTTTDALMKEQLIPLQSFEKLKKISAALNYNSPSPKTVINRYALFNASLIGMIALGAIGYKYMTTCKTVQK